jgi:hypothetical protein
MIVPKENSVKYAWQETIWQPDEKIISAKNKTCRFLNNLDDVVFSDFNWFFFKDARALYQRVWHNNIIVSSSNIDKLQKADIMRWKYENQVFNE